MVVLERYNGAQLDTKKEIHEMKNLIFALLFILCFQVKAFSEVYVYTKKNTNEVIFVTEENNVVISSEDKDKIKETILPNDLEFYALTELYSDYKLAGNKFILNTQKISDRAAEKVDRKNKKDKRDADFESAKSKLINLGLNSDEVDSLK